MSNLMVVEAVIDDEGAVRLIEPSRLEGARRAIVVILDAESVPSSETALLSEAALETDWTRREEDEAWSYLQPDP